MKKFLSIFVALAMVLSLFAGVGARTAKAATVAVGTAAAVAGTQTITYTLTTGTFVVAATSAWPLGGANVADLGFVTGVVLSAGNTVATITVSGTVVVAHTYTVAPTQAAFDAAFTPPAAATVTVAPAPTAVATAAAVVGTTTITYTLTTGAFVAAATTIGNWTLGGANVADITPIIAAGVVLSAGNTVATITVTGAAVTGHVYTVAPAQAAFGVAFTAPAPATVTLSAAPIVIPAQAIAGVVAPVRGATPVTTVTAGTGFTAVASWSPAATTFAASTVYTATITLTPATGYTVTGVTANQFSVTGAAVTTNAANSGVVTAVFPVTAAAPAPVAPAGIVTLAPLTQVAGTTSVLLSWNYSVSPTDATAFAISRNGTVIGYVAAATMTYTDAATVAGMYYSYFVTPMNGALLGTQSFSQSILTTAAVATTTTTTTSTLGLTTTGTFVGGVDGSGALGVNGTGIVVSGAGTSYVVNVTTAAVGAFDADDNGIQILHDTGVTSIDTDWATTGIQTITLLTLPITGILNVGDTIRVAGSSTNGAGKILGIDTTGTHAVVNVTTAAVGVIGPQIYKTSYLNSGVIDANWMTVGTAQPIIFDSAVTLVPGDILHVYMLQAVPATSATAFFMVTGTPVVGDVATVTWQDTTGASHSVSYTTVAGDTSNKVALALSQLIDALDVTTGNVYVSNTPITGSVVQLTQDVGGVAGNGKTLTGTTTAASVPTLTICTVGGLTQPAYLEQGKTLQLVAKDATGAVISVTWTSSMITNGTVSTTGLVTAASVASDLTGVTVITATSGTATGVFAVVVIPVQIITSLTINLVPAVTVSTTSQQFGAIASNAAYSALDYTTQAVWTDALPVASIKATTGLLTYSTDETGNVYASAGGITATANVKIASGVVTLIPVVGPVTKVIVLTIGSDIVTVDDKATTVDAAPEIVDGRTFVPIRFIAETFGSTVTWLPETKGVTIVLGDVTIGLQIGNATAVINANIIALDAAPYIKNSRTMVPLRVISESFGGNVAWDPINHIITITYVLPVVVPAA